MEESKGNKNGNATTVASKINKKQSINQENKNNADESQMMV